MKRRLKSLRHAWDGLRHLLRTQPNARLHLVATLVVVALGILLRVSRSDWCWLAAAIAAVWTAEACNTALELLGDAVTREPHPLIGRAKDCAAAAVLCASLGAVVIGGIIFAPHVTAWFAR